MVRHSVKTSELWKTLPWRKFRKNVFRLQCRIWKAVRTGDTARARNLQKLLLKSKSASLLAIRQVTQLNAGKRTAGIDGKAKLNFEQRLQLEQELNAKAQNWQHQKLREIPIPKKDGTKRILKVPTISDRAWQCLVKYALEPAHEATFHARSYGFRPGRSAHDAQKLLYLNLSSKQRGKDKRILELDIEKCFDRIDHQYLFRQLIAPQCIKLGLWKCVKTGVNPEFPPETFSDFKSDSRNFRRFEIGEKAGRKKPGAEQGTPQGGVVSPLLANIALNGIERIGEYKGSDYVIRAKCIRYADDMVYILKPEDDAEKLRQEIDQLLAQRGLKVKEAKTRLVAATDGFDFLGWHFKVQDNGKFRSYPSEDNFKAFRKKVKEIVNNSSYGAKTKAKKLAPIVRGWRNYHHYCKMEGSRFSLYHTQNRTFKVFNKEERLNRYSTKKLLNQAFPPVGYAEHKHVNVKGDKSPYDGDILYWSKRKSKHYDGATSRALVRQNHSCGYCGLKFADSEKVHLHHGDGDHDNWNPKNLLAIHESCHDYIHMSKRET